MMSVFCDKYQYLLHNSDKNDYKRYRDCKFSKMRNEITLFSLDSLKQFTRETITLKR